jgi:hypothetical protein
VAKRKFIVQMGQETLELEGHEPRALVIRYLMKRRRSLLSTKDPTKVDTLYQALPKQITVKSTKSTRSFIINWERVGTGEFEGARFAFTLEETGS